MKDLDTTQARAFLENFLIPEFLLFTQRTVQKNVQAYQEILTKVSQKKKFFIYLHKLETKVWSIWFFSPSEMKMLGTLY